MDGYLRRSDAVSLIGRLAEALLKDEHERIPVWLADGGNLWINGRLAATIEWERE